MNNSRAPIGLYIHIPFCAGKCPYCDFYSFAADGEAMDQYCRGVAQSINFWAAKLQRPIDTLYFGGGTPSLIGAERLANLVETAVFAFKAKEIGGGKRSPYNGMKADNSLSQGIGGGKPPPYNGMKAGNSLCQGIGGGKPPPYNGMKADNSLCQGVGGGKPLTGTVTQASNSLYQPVGRGLAPAEDKLSSLDITVECNPSNVGASDSCFDFERLAQSGVNRISLGLQSAVDSERRALGRKGLAEDVTRAIDRAKSVGIHNISLDLMLGIPGQTMESLQHSIDFCANAGITHVSAYMLKIEKGTTFAAQKDTLVLPTEDETCAFYLKTCEELEKAGFIQYEISNFAQKGFESRHNLKYWNCEEYLGIGPSAHSFIDGKRFYYKQDLQGFLNSSEPVQDGDGGDFEEYAMLRLRLNEGLTECETLERYGFGIPMQMRERAKPFVEKQLLTADVKGIRFTPEGFLLSNQIIGDLLQ